MSQFKVKFKLAKLTSIQLEFTVKSNKINTTIIRNYVHILNIPN